MGVENIELVGIGQFIDISGNFGRITQGIFGDQAFNSGLIYTTAVFSNSSNNTGVVLSAAFFEDIATNNGFLSSIASFDDLSINNGSIVLSAAFLGQANNSGTVYGSASFSASAINDTTGIVGQANFLGTAVNAGSAIIALFADSAINSGSISLSALFTESSSNAPGATVLIAVFNGASTNSGTVSLSASFNDTAANNITGIIPIAIFNGSSVNNGYIINVATFNGTASNGLNGIVTEATFADTSTNAGSATSATFGDSSSNLSTGIISNATFTATSVNAGSAISASFLDEASNSPTGQVTTAVFSASSVNSGTVIQQALFEGLATNSNTGNVQGTVTFSGSAVNTGTVAQAIFLDFASNTGTVTTSATFADSAANSGTVQGDAVFSDTTTNTGTIQGNAQIAPTATDSGTVIGNTVIFEHLYSYANSTYWSDDAVLVDGSIIYTGPYTLALAATASFIIGTDGTAGFGSVSTNEAGIADVTLVDHPQSNGTQTYGSTVWWDDNTIISGTVVYAGQYTNSVAVNSTFYIGTNGQDGYASVLTDNNGVVTSISLINNPYSSGGYYYLNSNLGNGDIVFTGQYTNDVAANVTFYIGTDGQEGYASVVTDSNGIAAITAVNHPYSSGGFYHNNATLSINDFVYSGQYTNTVVANMSYYIGTDGQEGYSNVITDGNGVVTSITAVNHTYFSGSYYYDNSTPANGDVVYTGQYSLTVAANVAFFIGTDGQAGYSSVTTDGSGIATVTAVNHSNSSNGYYHDNVTIANGDVIYTGQYTNNLAVNVAFYTGTDGESGYSSVTTDGSGIATVIPVEHLQHNSSFNFWWNNVPLADGDIVYTGAYTNNVAVTVQFYIGTEGESSYSYVTTDNNGVAFVTPVNHPNSSEGYFYDSAILGNGEPVYTGQYTYAIATNVSFYIGTEGESGYSSVTTDSYGIATVIAINHPYSSDGYYYNNATLVDGDIVYVGQYTNDVAANVAFDITGYYVTTDSSGVATLMVYWYEDTSANDFLITLNGTVTQEDEGGGVLVADFAGGRLTTTLTAIGTDDYTFETFVKLDANSGYRGNVIAEFRSGNDSNNALIYFGGAGGSGGNAYADLDLYAGGQHNMTTAITDSVWHHVAITRSSGTSRMYIDGVKVGETSVSYDITNTGLIIGDSINFATETADQLQGRLAGYRIIKGTALYTESTYTIPTSLPTAVSGTHLLLNFGATAAPTVTPVSNWYDDTSSSARTVTLNGTVTQSDEGSGVKGAITSSGHLSISNSADFAFAGDFTIEAFVKPTDLSGTHTIVCYNDNASDLLGWTLFRQSNSIVGFAVDTDGIPGSPAYYVASPGIDLRLNEWNHIAVGRAGNLNYLYLNGIRVINNTLDIPVTLVDGGVLNVGCYISGQLNRFVGTIANLRIVGGTSLYEGPTLTIPTSLPTDISGTKLLLNFGATAVPAVTPGSIWYGDASSAARAVSLNGTVTQEDEGSGVLVADFNNGYLSIDNPMSLATGDFTVEYFIKYDSAGIGYQPGVALYTPNAADQNATFISYIEAANYFSILMTNTAGNTWQTYVPGNDRGPQVSPVANQWNHVAATRSGNTFALYLNGVLIGTNSINETTIYDVNRVLEIGRYTAFPGGSLSLYGRIAGLRIVKGTALYSGSIYTVPTSLPTAVSGTELLLNFGATAAPTVPVGNWYGDSSPGARSVSLNGTVTQSDEGGGVVAASFSNSYLYINDTAFDFSGVDFTIEAFIKPNSLNGEQTLISTAYPTDSSGIFLGALNDGAYVAVGQGYGWSSITSFANAYSVNQWAHVAFVRSSSTFSVYVNGVIVGSFTNNITLNNINNSILIGGRPLNNQYFDGKIAALRIVKGTALYSGSSYTVPTSLPTAVAGTELLLNFGATAVPVVPIEDLFTDASISGEISGNSILGQYTVHPYSYTTHGNRFYQNGVPYTGIYTVTDYTINYDGYGIAVSFTTSPRNIRFIVGVEVAGDPNIYAGASAYTLSGNLDISYLGLTTFANLRLDNVTVTGSFNCSWNSLTTLQYGPVSVGTHYNCDGNDLVSLQYGPTTVNGDFSCQANNLTSLQYGPTAVSGGFACSTNSLTNLEHGPVSVGSFYWCDSNPITSLQGAPSIVPANFSCQANNFLTNLAYAPSAVDFNCSGCAQLTSLQGISPTIPGNFSCISLPLIKNLQGGPSYIGGSFNCSNTGLTSLEGAPSYIGGAFNCTYSNLSSLQGGPSYVGDHYMCSNNKLTTLQGAPLYVYSLHCGQNQLTTLEGAPLTAVTFNCNYNNLNTLSGGPITVQNEYLCENNRLVTLQGAPSFAPYFSCANNLLTSLQGVAANHNVFVCNSNRLSSLAGGPSYVNTSFDCRHNSLSSLEGGPITAGTYMSEYNKLATLKGAPSYVSGPFRCSYNSLSSLQYGPNTVGGEYLCRSNHLTTLQYAPSALGGSIGAEQNLFTFPIISPDVINRKWYYTLSSPRSLADRSYIYPTSPVYYGDDPTIIIGSTVIYSSWVGNSTVNSNTFTLGTSSIYTNSSGVAVSATPVFANLNSWPTDRPWYAVRTSADGLKLIAFRLLPGNNYDTYTSVNAGNTFNVYSFAAGTFAGIVNLRTNASGNTMHIITRAMTIRRSTDAGVTWTAPYGINYNQFLQDMAISDDGNYAVISGESTSGGIFYSTNGLASWQSSSTDGGYSRFGVINSTRDGSKVIAVASLEPQFTHRGPAFSTNYGASFTTFNIKSSPVRWVDAVISSTAQMMVAAEYNGYVWVSTNQGSTWTSKMTETNRSWSGVAVSGSGEKMAAITSDGQLFISMDYGTTWNSRVIRSGGTPQGRGAITMSENGNVIYFIAGNRLYFEPI